MANDLWVYYAHSKQIYGTVREKRELELLRRIFRNVVCPNQDLGEVPNIQFYLARVRECEIVVASEVEKHIGRGVYEELHYAQNLGRLTLVLRHDTLYPIAGMELIPGGDWKIHYAKLFTLEEKLTHA
jgi:hypothetical protein